MRLVACLLAGLFLATIVPMTTTARDECASANVAGVPACVAIPSPAPVHGYYIYLSWVQCPLNQICQASPPARLVGVLWEETNGASGLQRSSGVVLGFPADTPILW